MLTLLECMKNNLPSNDSSKFKTTESHMDWEKVAFKDFSGDMCKLKWVEISNEVTASHFLTCVNTYLHMPFNLREEGETCHFGQKVFMCSSVSSNLCLRGGSGPDDSSSLELTVLPQSF